MAYKSDAQIVASLMKKLSLVNLTDAEIESWAQGATNIATVQQKLEQVGKEVRDIEQVVAKALKRISEQ